MECDELNYIAFREKDYDDKTMNEIKVHLKTCKKCQQEHKQYNALVDELMEYWLKTRESCLSEAQLEKYVDGTVSNKEKDIFERHLTLCPACTREMEVLQKIKMDIFEVLPMDETLSSIEQIKKRIYQELSKFKEQIETQEGKELSFGNAFVGELSKYVSGVPNLGKVPGTIDTVVEQPIMNFKADEKNTWQKIEKIELLFSSKYGKKEKLSHFKDFSLSVEGDVLKYFFKPGIGKKRD